MLPPLGTKIVEDLLFLRFLLDRGGEYLCTYQELDRLGRELDGWGVKLSANDQYVYFRVCTPEMILETPKVDDAV